MDIILAQKMIVEIDNWLAIKSITGAEQALLNKMQTLFADAAKQTLKRLKESDTVSIRSLEETSNTFRYKLLKSLPQVIYNSVEGTIGNRQSVDILKNKIFSGSQATIERMTGNVMKSLSDSMREGLGVREAASKLADKFEDMEFYELKRIARTEMHGAAELERYNSRRNNTFTDYQQWWTTLGPNVREDEDVENGVGHTTLHGQIVAVGTPFSNGLYFAGDTDGDLDQWINCQCNVLDFYMPVGKAPPSGKTFFYEEDLVDVEEFDRTVEDIPLDI